MRGNHGKVIKLERHDYVKFVTKKIVIKKKNLNMHDQETKVKAVTRDAVFGHETRLQI